MASSAKELDLNPDVYIGLTYPIKSGENLDFELDESIKVLIGQFIHKVFENYFMGFEILTQSISIHRFN